MANITDALKDLALGGIPGTVRVDICHTTEPATYAAIATQTCGNATGVSVGAASDSGSGTGRSKTVAAVSNGTVTASQTAAFWAISNGTDTLYATGPITPTQAVTSGNTFTLDAIEIVIRDASSF